MTDNPAYQNQPYAPPPQRKGAGMAITALILGILALLLFWTIAGGIVLGLVALILGMIASGRAKRGVASGRAMAIIGAILGLLGLLLSIAVIVFGAVFLRELGFGSYQDCVQDAGGDQDAIEQCARDFERDVNERFN